MARFRKNDFFKWTHNGSFAVANMLLISNKISINKNKRIDFFYFFLIFIY